MARVNVPVRRGRWTRFHRSTKSRRVVEALQIRISLVGETMNAEIDVGQRHPRNGHRQRSSRAPAGAPDLAVLARDAVVGFLHDASIATAQREATRTGGAVAGGEAAAAMPTGNN